MRCSSQLAVMPTYALFEAKKSGVMNDVIKLTARVYGGALCWSSCLCACPLSGLGNNC